MVLPLRVGVRPPRQEQSGQVRVALVARPHERRPPALGEEAEVGISAVMESSVPSISVCMILPSLYRYKIGALRF